MRKRPVHVGELDQQVSLVSKTPTEDDMGGATTAENVYAADIWAHIRPLKGGESQASDRIEARRAYLVVIRHRDDVTEGHVVRWGARDFNVRFVRQASPRELYLALECELGAAV